MFYFPIFFLSLIIYPKIIYSECILGKEVSKPVECVKESKNGTYCCYLTPLNDHSLPSICYPIAINRYLGNRNINYNKKPYEIDCGVGSKFMDANWGMTLEDREICGSESPDSYENCSVSSTDDNSCCFYKNEDLKGCYWLGIKYSGKVEKDGWEYICQGRNLYFKKVYYFWIIFRVIFLWLLI